MKFRTLSGGPDGVGHGERRKSQATVEYRLLTTESYVFLQMGNNFANMAYISDLYIRASNSKGDILLLPELDLFLGNLCNQDLKGHLCYISE